MNESLENLLDSLLSDTINPEGPLGKELYEVLIRKYDNCMISLRDALLEVVSNAGSTLYAIINSIENWAVEQLGYGII